MTQLFANRRYTLEEYFRLEEESQEKHEFWDGYIVNLSELIGMAGGTYEHSRITAKVIAAMSPKLKDRGCSMMSSDMRTKIPRTPLYFYPDVSVLCGKPEFDPKAGERTTLLNPKVVIEVLSPSTESYDRGKKLAQYIKIPSLEEYVLVSQDEPRLDTFFRHVDGSWTFSVAAGLDATVALRSMGIDVPLAEIYAGIEFPPQKESPVF